MANVHVEPVTHDCQRVADYVFKTVIRRRLSYEDAVLVLPRTCSELTVQPIATLSRTGMLYAVRQTWQQPG